MSISIYSPQVRREAQTYGITELQAYRKLNAQAILRERLRTERRTGSRSPLFAPKEGN